MAKLSIQEVKNFKLMLHELKEAFLKKREEAQGSRERMKSLADKCVQAYNEAEKRKALGRPGIDPRMAAKKKKQSTVQSAPSRQDEPRIVFPSSMTGSKPKDKERGRRPPSFFSSTLSPSQVLIQLGKGGSPTPGGSRTPPGAPLGGRPHLPLPPL